MIVAITRQPWIGPFPAHPIDSKTDILIQQNTKAKKFHSVERVFQRRNEPFG